MRITMIVALVIVGVSAVYLVSSVAVPGLEWDTNSAVLEAAAVQATQTPPVLLNGQYDDQLVDIDGDGVDDTLEIKVGVTANFPAYYTVGVVLVGGAGDELARGYGGDSLIPGSNMVAVQIRGSDLQRSGVGGPYTTKSVSISGGHGILAYAKNAYTTAAYALSSFGALPVVFSGAYADIGEDYNSNGQLDALKLSADVVVSEPGTYTVGAGIIDATEGYTIYESEAVQTLGVTSTVVSVTIPGRAIASSRRDGPYTVNKFVIIDEDGNLVSTSGSNPHTTGPYSFTDFLSQGDFPTIEIVSEEVIDVQAMNTSPPSLPYEYLRINLRIHDLSTAPGLVPGARVSVSAMLNARNGETVASAINSLPVEQLPNDPSGAEVVVDVPGGDIFSSGIDGPYRVSAELRSNAGERWSQDYSGFSTAAYTASAFAMPLVEIVGPVVAQGVDDNQNGRFERLRFTVPIQAGAVGEVTAQGIVVDDAGVEVGRVMAGFDQANPNNATTPGEMLMVDLDLPGSTILSSGMDGPYTLRALHVYHKNDAKQFLLEDYVSVSDPFLAVQFE